MVKTNPTWGSILVWGNVGLSGTPIARFWDGHCTQQFSTEQAAIIPITHHVQPVAAMNEPLNKLPTPKASQTWHLNHLPSAPVILFRGS